MFRSMDEEICKLFSVKRQETLTRSMNDNDDAIFAAVSDEYKNPELILGNCYFHLTHRSKCLRNFSTLLREH